MFATSHVVIFFIQQRTMKRRTMKKTTMKRKEGFSTLEESKMQVKLAHPNPTLAYISSLARACCMTLRVVTT